MVESQRIGGSAGKAERPPLGPHLRRVVGAGLLGIAFIMILWAVPLIWFLRLVEVPLAMIALAVVAIIAGLYMTRDRERGLG